MDRPRVFKSSALAVSAKMFAVAAIVAGLSGSVAYSATTSPPQPRVSPPVPHIVRPDGTLDLSYFQGTHMWEPPGYSGPHHYVSPRDFLPPTLTPSQVAAMTPQQRRANDIISVP